MPTVQPPLKYHGGKHYLSDWIVSWFPPHTHYVEAFAGGLAVLLRKDPNGISEVINDFDGDLTNFWRVLKDEAEFAAFQRRVEATPFSSKEFGEADFLDPDDDAVERAVKFFVRCRQSRQGLRKDFATMSRSRTRRGMNDQVSSWLTAIDGLPEIHERLKRVVIFNEDAVAVIKREDSSDTLYYCDPPYLHETRVVTDAYACEMTGEDHERFLITLAGIEGKFLLSGYRNDLYDAYADRNGWHRVDREIDCKASSASVKPRRIESLWMNYEV